MKNTIEKDINYSKDYFRREARRNSFTIRGLKGWRAKRELSAPHNGRSYHIFDSDINYAGFLCFDGRLTVVDEKFSERHPLSSMHNWDWATQNFKGQLLQAARYLFLKQQEPLTKKTKCKPHPTPQETI